MKRFNPDLPCETDVLKSLSVVGGAINFDADVNNNVNKLVITGASGVVPDCINELKFLEQVSFIDCKNLELPIILNPELVEINHSSVKLPSVFGGGVKKLVLFYDKFPLGYDFSELGNYKCLDELTIERCYLKGDNGWSWLNDFPNSITRLVSLKSLVYRQPNAVIPECVSDLINLEELTVAHHLQEIPKGVSRLSKLRKLYLCGNYNKIPELNDGLRELCIESFRSDDSFDFKQVSELVGLEKLVLITDALNEVPEFLADFKSLKRLELVSNKLKSIDNVKLIPGLECLTVHVDNRYGFSEPYMRVCMPFGEHAYVGTPCHTNALKEGRDSVLALPNLKVLKTSNTYLLDIVKDGLTVERFNGFAYCPSWPEFHSQENDIQRSYGD